MTVHVDSFKDIANLMDAVIDKNDSKITELQQLIPKLLMTKSDIEKS